MCFLSLTPALPTTHVHSSLIQLLGVAQNLMSNFGAANHEEIVNPMVNYCSFPLSLVSIWS